MKRVISLLLCVMLVLAAAFSASGETEIPLKAETTAVTEEKKPPAVQELKAYKTSENSITMHWKKVDGAELYAVYKYNSKEKKYKLLATTAETKYTAAKLKPGSTYKFVVKSVAVKGEKKIYSKSSSELKAVTAPQKIGGIYTDDIENDSITLSWQSLSGATTYEVWLFDKKQGEFVLHSVGEKNKVTVGGLSENTLYSFKVRAVRKIDGAVAYGRFSDIFSEFTNTSWVPRTNAQAAKLYNTKIKALKNEKNITVKYKKTISTQTKSCSKQALLRTVKNMMNLFEGKLERKYQFKGGKNKEVSLSSLIQPKFKNSSIRAKDIKSFEVKSEKGSIVLSITLKSDITEYDGKTKKEGTPSHNRRAVTVPQIAKQDTMPVEIKSVASTFEGSKLTLKLNENFKVKSLKLVCPAELEAKCRVSTVDFSTVVGYTMTEAYSISYDA